jgi:hypothetical protein
MMRESEIQIGISRQYGRYGMSKLLNIVLVLFLVGPVDIALAARSPLSPKEVMAHHIAVIKKDDVDGVMADYAENAVIVMPTGTFIGAGDVRKFFVSLAAQHRDWSTFEVTQEVLNDGVVLQHNVKTGGIEVFVVRSGKIVFQAVQSQ